MTTDTLMVVFVQPQPPQLSSIARVVERADVFTNILAVQNKVGTNAANAIGIQPQCRRKWVLV